MRRLLTLALCLTSLSVAAELRVVVGLPVINTLVSDLLGEGAEVTTLLQPGQVPELFESTSRQMQSAARADALILMGFPAERRWAELLTPSRVLVLYDEQQASAHPWTNPREVMAMVRRVAKWMTTLEPDRAPDLEVRRDALLQRLEALDQRVNERLAAHTGEPFVVYHPAWSAFAERYGLAQMAIERDGHEPDARHLALLLREARVAGIHRIYRQPQEDSRLADSVAGQLSAEIVVFDPLAADYFRLIEDFAEALAVEFEQRD